MRKIWEWALLTVLVTTIGIARTANAASTPPRENEMEEMLRYLRTQYPNVEIPSSADVVWVEPTGKGPEADIAKALQQGAVVTRFSDPNGTPTRTDTANANQANATATKYPQAPDPFQVATGNFGEDGNDEDFDDDDTSVSDKTADREIQDAQLARHWLDIREDLALREIDRKALDLVQGFATAKHAAVPVSLQGQNGALSYAYGDHIPRIVCRPNHLTDIALQPGEKVTAVHAGDTARWQISPAQSGTDGLETVHVVIKPLMPDIRTNLLVMTDRRTYNLDLLSSANDFIPSLRFSYPDDAAKEWTTFIAERRKQKEDEILLADASYALSPDDLYFGYEIAKGKELSWRPVRIFDDGVKTYIEMPAKYKSLEAPVLMFYEGSQLKLVNYRVKDRFYVVDRIMTKKAVLMAGKSRVVIERQKDNKKSRNRMVSVSDTEVSR
jgi:type IV secretion system protein VirB9